MDTIARILVTAGYGSTSAIESVWLVFSIICLTVSLDCARDAYCLVRSAGSPSRDPVEWWIATGTLRTEVLSHVNQQMVFTLIGFISALAPPRPDLPTEPLAVILALAFPVLLIYVQGVNAVDAVLRRRGRHRIHDYLFEEHLKMLEATKAGGRRVDDAEVS